MATRVAIPDMVVALVAKVRRTASTVFAVTLSPHYHIFNFWQRSLAPATLIITPCLMCPQYFVFTPPFANRFVCLCVFVCVRVGGGYYDPNAAGPGAPWGQQPGYGGGYDAGYGAPPPVPYGMYGGPGAPYGG